jgi:hypothetical protein
MSKEWVDANIDTLAKFQNLISFYQGENKLDFFLSDIQGNRIHLESIDRMLQSSPITLSDLLIFVSAYGTAKPLLAWIHRELFLKGDPFVLAGVVMLMDVTNFSVSFQSDLSVQFRYKFSKENIVNETMRPISFVKRTAKEVHYLIDFDDLVELLDTMNMTPFDLRNIAQLHCDDTRKLTDDGEKMICTLLMRDPLDGSVAKWRTQLPVATGGFYSGGSIQINPRGTGMQPNTTYYTTTTNQIFMNSSNPIAINRIVSGELPDDIADDAA